jgi:hypothetical protein
MPFFLFAVTIIAGGAFANEGGAKCVEQNGFKPCIERMLDNGKAEFKVNE